MWWSGRLRKEVSFGVMTQKWNLPQEWLWLFSIYCCNSHRDHNPCPVRGEAKRLLACSWGEMFVRLIDLPCGDHAPLWMVVAAESVGVSVCFGLHHHPFVSRLPDQKSSAHTHTHTSEISFCKVRETCTLRCGEAAHLQSVTMDMCKPSGENWIAEIWFCP